jgi:D-tyrosyl-tRNA(Tyr) deacylase
MRALLQRVNRAAVVVDGAEVGSIGKGWAILLGIGPEDNEDGAARLANKIMMLRAFEDSAGKMNLDAKQAAAEFLVISQVTLYADLSRGRRPSLGGAALPQLAEPLVNHFAGLLQTAGFRVATGKFGAFMEVEIHNTGPVTFYLSTDE